MLCVCAMCVCLCGSYSGRSGHRVSHPTRHDDLQTLLWGAACTCPWSGTCGGGGSGGSIAINASVLVGNGSLYAHGGQVSSPPPSQIQPPSHSFRGRATRHPRSSIAGPSLRRDGSYLHDARAAFALRFPMQQGGSASCSSFGGAGSGGRIALHASTYGFVGTMSACGGIGLSTLLAAGPGTVYINDMTARNRSLLVSGGGE